MSDSPSTGGRWPMTHQQSDVAIEWTVNLCFEPVLISTLIEWATLRFRCHLKALKRGAMGRVAGKLHLVQSDMEMAQAVDQLTPEEAFALLQALRWLAQSNDRTLILAAPYRDEGDWQTRAPTVVARKALAWAQEQSSLFDTDEFLDLQE